MTAHVDPREIGMFKKVAAGAAALMIAAGAVAYAQQPPAGPEGGRSHFVPEDRAGFLSARVAALHAGLQLSPEQEKAWPAFEKAYRELAELRGHHRFGPRADESLDPVQRAQRRADALTARGAALKRYAETLAPLYKSLDDGQRRRFALLVHIGHHGHFRHFGYHHSGFRHDGEREHGGRDGFRGPRGEFRRIEFGLLH
jgi:zinc resistance-associated protein